MYKFYGCFFTALELSFLFSEIVNIPKGAIFMNLMSLFITL